MQIVDLMRAADWHGVQAADAWREHERHERAGNEERAKVAIAAYARHANIADRMWAA